jgi:hypothetical protein
MNPKLLLGLALALSGALVGCSTSKPTAKTVEMPPVRLAYALHDFDNDGNKDWLWFIWVDGKFGDDPEWPVGKRYQGHFIFRVEFADGRTVDTSCDALKVPFDFIFFDEQQPVEMRVLDFNNDGQPDFGIVSYGASNCDLVSLFTVLPSGKVETLKIAGQDGNDGLVVNKGENDSSFNLTPTGFYYLYSNWQQREDDLEFLDWDTQSKQFHLREQKIKWRN